MRVLTKEDKSQINCEVNIHLCYTDCDEVKERFNSLCKCLYSAHLVPTITKKERFGPCLNLNCSGDISLLDAEYVLSKDDEYVLPLEIRYNNGKFLLRNEVK